MGLASTGMVRELAEGATRAHLHNIIVMIEQIGHDWDVFYQFCACVMVGQALGFAGGVFFRFWALRRRSVTRSTELKAKGAFEPQSLRSTKSLAASKKSGAPSMKGRSVLSYSSSCSRISAEPLCFVLELLGSDSVIGSE